MFYIEGRIHPLITFPTKTAERLYRVFIIEIINHVICLNDGVSINV